MPTVKVFSIDTISDAGIDITVETDLISGGEPLRYGLSLTKANYLEWKTTHPTGTPKDYIIELVKERARARDGDEQRMGYRQAVSKLEQVNAVIMSPPYENTLHDDRIQREERLNRLRVAGYDEKYLKASFMQPNQNTAIDQAYSDSKKNIGNLKGQSYWSEMDKVYSEAWKVLKPEGKMVLVLKNFIRNKKVVDLAGDTVKLVEKLGFTLEDHCLFKLPQKSFWRVLYAKKHPEVDAKDLDYEHILVFRKEASGC